MTTLAHSPLHKGLLTERMLYRLDEMIAETERSGEVAEDIIELKEGLVHLGRLRDRAADTDHSLPALAIAWVAMQPETVVLTSPTDKTRLQDAKEGAAWRLDEETLGLVREAQGYFAGTDFADFTARLMRSLKIYYR